MLKNYISWGVGFFILVATSGTAMATKLEEKLAPHLSTDLLLPEGKEAKLHPKPVFQASYTLWDRIRGGFKLERSLAHPLVQEKLKDYRRHPKTLKRTLTRATPFLYYLVNEIEKRKFPLELVFLPVVESAYNPYVNSIHNAAGIWQIIPRTADYLGLKRNPWYEGRRDIHASTKAALDYLGYLYKRFDNNWVLAIAAYNIGEGTLERAIQENKRKGISTDFWALPLTKIPRNYIAALLAFSELVAHPTKYAVRLNPVPNSPYLAKINLKKPIGLGWIARMTQLTPEEIYFLNPGLNRGTTPPSGPYHLLLPISKVKRLELALNQIRASEGQKQKGTPLITNPFVFQRAENISETFIPNKKRKEEIG